MTRKRSFSMRIGPYVTIFAITRFHAGRRLQWFRVNVPEVNQYGYGACCYIGGAPYVPEDHEEPEDQDGEPRYDGGTAYGFSLHTRGHTRGN